MPSFDIPIIATVEADTIEEARQIAYRMVEAINDKHEERNAAHTTEHFPTKLSPMLAMADDSITNRVNQRIVFLHPDDVDSSYDFDAYNAALEKED